MQALEQAQQPVKPAKKLNPASEKTSDLYNPNDFNEDQQKVN
jgi:hypothetical protein